MSANMFHKPSIFYSDDGFWNVLAEISVSNVNSCCCFSFCYLSPSCMPVLMFSDLLYLSSEWKTICTYMDTFFWVGKNFQNKFPKNTTFVIISLNFWNDQWNSRKKFFIVSMIGLQTWNSKIKGKNWEKWSFVFFLFENQILWLKSKITFPALYWFLEN